LPYLFFGVKPKDQCQENGSTLWYAAVFDLGLPRLGKPARNPICPCPSGASLPESQFALALAGQARLKIISPLPCLGKLA